MALDPTDNLIVQRADTLGTIEIQNMATIQDNDLLIVGRGSESYKISGADFKADVGGSIDLTGSAVITPTDVFVGDVITCVASVTGGTPPITYGFTWELDANNDGNFVTIGTNQTYTVEQKDVGGTIRCVVFVNGANGGALTLTSNNTNTINDPSRVPEIGDVTLTEDNPGFAPRFTNQKFDVAIDMVDDGSPASTKFIDAYVEGTFTSNKQFDEPLESTSSSGFEYEDGLTYSTAGSTAAVTEVGVPADMFDGIIGGQRAYGYYTTVQNSNCLFYVYPQADADWVEGPCYVGVQVYSNSRWAGGNTRPTVQSDIGSWTMLNNTSVSNGNFYIEVPAGQRLGNIRVQTRGQAAISSSFAQIAGFWKFDSQPVAGDFTSENALKNIPVKTDLVFAAGTDMSALEAGDEVRGEPKVVDYTSWLTAENGYESGRGPENAFDGDLLNTFVRCSQGYGYTLTIPDGVDVQSIGVHMLGNNVYNGQVSFRNENNGVIFEAFADISGVKFIELANPNIRKVYCYGYGGSVSTGPTVYGFTLNGELLLNGDDTSIGTVDSVTDTTVTLTEKVDGWVIGENVTGPDKTVVEANVKKYLHLDNNANVIDLLDAPQPNTFTATDENIRFPITFPATLPSGQAPDDEMAEGTTIAFDVSASNSAGIVGPKTSNVVQPALDGVLQFDEPLESSGSTGSEIPAETWSDYVTLDGGGGGQTDMFNDDVNTACYGFSNSSFIRWAPPKETFGYFDDLVVKFGIDFGGSWLWEVRTETGTTQTYAATITGSSFADYATELDISTTGLTEVVEVALKYVQVGATRINRTWINGVPVINGDEIILVPGNQTLTFAAGTDMSTLAPGDTVTQSTTTGVVGNVTGTTVELSSSSGTWTDGVNVVGPEKSQFRAMTREEFEAQALKFGTYTHRKHVNCARLAEEQRDALIQYFADQGYTLEDILTYL